MLSQRNESLALSEGLPLLHDLLVSPREGGFIYFDPAVL